MKNRATKTTTAKVTGKPRFTIKQLLEAGVHFGHKTMKWNPKMAPYLYGTRHKMHIIDLNKTGVLLHEALTVVRNTVRNNGKILFVGTKKQAIDIIEEEATRCGQHYVNFRWLGGTLTNWKTVSRSIKTMANLEREIADEESLLNKKEKLNLDRKRVKLELVLGGIRNMGGYPSLVFVVDSNKEALAIAEARNIKAPVIAILDSNSDPDGIEYPVPGNDDSTKAIKLYCRLVSGAVLDGMRDSLVDAGIDIGIVAEASIEEMMELKKGLGRGKDNSFIKKETPKKASIRKIESKKVSRVSHPTPKPTKTVVAKKEGDTEIVKIEKKPTKIAKIEEKEEAVVKVEKKETKVVKAKVEPKAATKVVEPKEKKVAVKKEVKIEAEEKIEEK